MSNENIKRLKQEIRRLTEERESLLEIFFLPGKLILGSHMATRMRCGTAGCHCHADGGHPTFRISRWVNGKLISKIVRIDDREWVAEAAANYKACKQAMRGIAKINAREKKVLKLVVQEKSQIYG
jgi:hypothetical protein